MIKKFRLFEKYGYDSIKKDLIDILGSEYIDDYFMENYDIDVEEVIELWPNLVDDNIDDDSFVDDWIRNEIDSLSMEDFSEYDYKEYIRDNTTPELEGEVIKFYREVNDMDEISDIESEIDGKVEITRNKKNKDEVIITGDDGIKKYEIPDDFSIIVYDGDIITSGTVLATDKSLEYDDDMLDDLSEEQLREVIENCDKEEDFVETVIKNRYEGYSAMEIIKDIYGSNMSGKELYNMVRFYINDDDIIDKYKNDTDEEYKEDFVIQRIEDDEEIIEHILENDKKNILLVVDYFDSENLAPDIANEYEFQNSYIEQTVENYFEGSEHNEKEEDEVIADALVFLNDHFELNWRIEEEYEDNMWKITSGKYNI